MGAKLAPHSLAVPPLHLSNTGPILKTGSQGVDVSPRASRRRYNPTGPARSPAALRMSSTLPLMALAQVRRHDCRAHWRA
jgi:hypothetical protein